MKKVRWGILSTANIAQTQFIPAIKRADNAEAVAIASRGEKVYQVAEKLNIPKAYESYEELLNDEEIEAVYIPLPNHLHKEWIVKAAHKGKHILCEKPVALTTEEAIEIAQVCKETNVKFMEGFMYQFHPQHDRVREILASGEIGDIKLFKSSHSFFMEDRDTNIRMNKERGGGALYDVGCYSIHALRTVLQSEPVEVHAHAEIDSDTQVDVSTFVYLKLENGIPAVIDCSFEMIGRNEYEIIGTKGTIKVPYAFRPDFNGGIGHVVVTKGNEKRVEKIAGDIYRLEVEHFSKAILEDLEPLNTLQSTIQNMRVIDAC